MSSDSTSGLIGIVLVSHGGLADELTKAMEHVVGKQEGVAAIGIAPQDDMDEARERIVEAVKAVDAGRGVVILSDMFGGTPSNLAISLLDTHQVDVVAGANLPMLIKLAELRGDKDLAETIIAAAEAGRHYIRVASQILNPTAKKAVKGE